MRVWLLAGLIVLFCSIFFAAILLADRIIHVLPTPALIAFVFTLVFILSILALNIFHLAIDVVSPTMDFAHRFQEWEAQGLLITEKFQALRAFQVEESEDEGPHFFLELEDKSVLYLNGQYLYNFDEDEDEDSVEPPFPCTEFTIKRHRQDDQTVALTCQGEPLEFESLPIAFWNSDYWNRFSFYDGERITDRTYDQLKTAS